MKRLWLSPLPLCLLIVLTLLALATGCNVIPAVSTDTPGDTSASATPDAGQADDGPVTTNPLVIPPVEASQDKKDAEPSAPMDEDLRYVYLTFDDGPNTPYTERVLDILAFHRAKATFFVVGENVKRNPEIMERILAEGHGVANHTYSHNFKLIYASPAALIKDLEEGAEAITAHTGQPANIFRAPGGPSMLSAPFWRKLKEQGYQSVSWNVTGADSTPGGITSRQVLESVSQGLDKVEKLNLTPIILLHDGTQLYATEVSPGSTTARYIQNRESVVKALPDIIEMLKSRGYTFAIVDENTPDAWGS